MPATILGGTPATAVKTGDKFRASWNLTAAQFLPSSFVDADGVAHQLQAALPAIGFYTVSNPSALPGDSAVVFDIRSTQLFPGHTVADVVNALDSLPAFSGGWATSLAQLQLLASSGVSSTQLARDQAAARDAANQAASSSSLAGKISSALKGAGILALVIGGAVLFVVLKGASKDWE